MTHLLDKFTATDCVVETRSPVDYLRTILCVLFVMMLLGNCTQTLSAQKKTSAPAQKPSSAEKVIENYLKAIGGKKRVAAIRDSTYEWIIQLKEQQMGIAKTQTKAPASIRMEMSFGNGQLISAANARSAWMRGLDGKLHTLTDAEAAAARLQAVLEASRLLDLKKSNVLARVVSARDSEKDLVYVVEFSVRSGARLRYLFSSNTKLLLSIEDDARKTTTRFEDYRAEGGILEPHLVSIDTGDTRGLTFVLHKVIYNTGIADSIFDPPRGAEALKPFDEDTFVRRRRSQ